MANISNFVFRQVSPPSGSIQQGAFHVGTITRLVSVEVTGSVFFGASSFTLASLSLDAPFVHGIQFGAHGYTPIALYGGANDPDWLVLEAVKLPTFEQFIDAAVTTVDGVGAYPISFKFRGQLPIGFDTDMYYTLQDVWSTGGTVKVSGQVRVLYY
jgi:hypothetical protein